jgi:hypothetical protein
MGAVAVTGGMIGFGSSAKTNPRLMRPVVNAAIAVEVFRAIMIVATPFASETGSEAVASLPDWNSNSSSIMDFPQSP